MSAPAFSVELWSDWPGAAGATAIGALTLVDGSFSEALDNSDMCAVTVVRDARVPVALENVIIISIVGLPYFGFRVTSIGETLLDERLTIRGMGPFGDLNTRGLVRSVVAGQPTFALGGRMAPADVLDDIVLPSLADDDAPYWIAGTIEPTAPETLTAPATGWTASEWLRQLADRTGSEVRARIDAIISLAIDVVARVGASAADVPIMYGKNLLTLFSDQNSGELASAVTVLGDVPSGGTLPASIAENAWTLGTIPGVAPYWIPLTDPAGGAAPIAFDDQCVGLYLLRSDGGTTQITDSRASDSAVLVAATTGLTAGQHVQIVADASATRMHELVTPGVKRLHRTDSLSGARGERNLLLNGLFLSGAANWTAQGGTCKTSSYPRTSPATFTGIVTNGSTAAASASISLRGFTPGDRLWLNEAFAITGKTVSGNPNPRVGNDYVEADGSGFVTITFLSGTLDALTADGTAVTMLTAGLKRPTAFPTEPDCADVLRFLSAGVGTMPPGATNVRLQSDAFTVKYIAGPLAQINVAAGFTMHNGNGSAIGNLDAGTAITEELALTVDRRLPGVMLRNNATAARLAYGIALRQIANNTTQEEVVTCSTTLTADTTLDVCLLPAFQPQSLYAACRWVSVWLGPSTDVPPYQGSWANKLWQRANRILVGRSLSARQLRVSLRDLSRAAGYSLTRESLTLGGTVTLVDLGITVRIIAITYDLIDVGNVEVLLDSRPTKLLTYLAERV